ncbi:hypothetical protein PVAP13_3KG374754 [Panicum virgatum]|uniref:Replication protein A 70 kDa DNA-binding subunit B/D first OB fold domain-containing protein n=1 Tax=Panicum virgatum TaxID=38727 RepID=A0A8T0V005_PANVG|nr:hypothetical protein PVAP13_3KG374754 [Panicum virgatum]
MACKRIKQLTTSGQAGNIKVKVIKMWESINFATDELMSLDMILMDEQGETIHATIWKTLINNYKAKINEGSIYELSNFKVQEDTRYRPVNNALKVVFIFNTNVKEVEDCSDKFPDYYFEFASKDTLLARTNIDKQYLDVMGLLTKIKQIKSRMILKNTANPRQKDIREIELLIMVNLTGGNRSGLTGYRSNRSGPVPVSAGTQPAKIQILNLNSKNKKFSKNS